MAKAKITVVKKLNTNDLYGENPPAPLDKNRVPECSVFSEGQEFVLDSLLVCPPGFCAWAYADIQRDLMHILWGGDCPYTKKKGVAIACCTDGLRPVIFKIERIED